MGAAIAAGAELVHADKLHEWQTWADAYADSIDPIKTGQVFAHLDPPEVN